MNPEMKGLANLFAVPPIWLGDLRRAVGCVLRTIPFITHHSLHDIIP